MTDVQGFRGDRVRRRFLVAVVLVAIPTVAAAAQAVAFQLDPQRTTVKFLVGDVLHTSAGTFRLKRGSLNLDPASGKLTGEIVVDARSGATGSGLPDRKMHREVLESERYPEITFHPDHVDGTLLLQGKSSVRVHGMFSIHGADHEITVPAEVEISSDHWTAKLHFAVPYAKWGMKNPSNFFLKVNESVDIDLTTTGTVTRP
jgi:polyisoprenoid-binding protein YceI